MTETTEASKQRGKRLGQAWFWISQVTSVIGLISILDDLKLWLAALAWLMARLRDILPLLSDLLRGLGGAIGVVLDLFRGFFRPIVEFLLQWLPFQVSDLAKDALVVVLFVGLSWLRNKIKFFWEWSAADYDETAALLAAAQRAGIACEDRDTGEIQYAIFCYWSLRDWNPEPDLKAKLQAGWDKAKSKYGEPLEAFANASPEFRRTSPRKLRLFDREIRANMLVWSLGAFTALLVLLDHVYMR